jgi:hypothetical protein
MTVLHNGFFVQNHVKIKGPTIFTGLPTYEKYEAELPLYRQGADTNWHFEIFGFENYN